MSAAQYGGCYRRGPFEPFTSPIDYTSSEKRYGERCSVCGKWINDDPTGKEEKCNECEPLFNLEPKSNCVKRFLNRIGLHGFWGT